MMKRAEGSKTTGSFHDPNQFLWSYDKAQADLSLR